MFVVVKIGGVNGSGKTTLAKGLISNLKMRPYPSQVKKPEAYIADYKDFRVVLLGSYENVCGGMDTISDKDERYNLVKKYAKKNTILFFEGLITGKTFGALGGLSDSHVQKKKGRWIYAFMDTPFEVCVERVLGRRAAAAAAKGKEPTEFDPERTMRPTYNSCVRLAEKLRERRCGAGLKHKVVELEHRQAGEKMATNLLNRAIRVFTNEGFSDAE